MSDDLLNILSNSNKDINNQKLMDYISNKSTDQDRIDVENSMIDSDFIADAVEGLNYVQNKDRINDISNTINTDFRNHLKKSKRKKVKQVLFSNSLMFYCIILILILVIIAYILIRKHLGV